MIDIRIRNEKEAAEVAALRDLLQGAVADTTPSWLWDASHLATTANELDEALLAWEDDR
jgi:hypothetical protein